MGRDGTEGSELGSTETDQRLMRAGDGTSPTDREWEIGQASVQKMKIFWFSQIIG
jgi:hypothetical protein